MSKSRNLINQARGLGRANDITDIVNGENTYSFPLMVRFVVSEVITDSIGLTDEKKRELRKRFNSTLEFLDDAPNNSVIAKPVRGGSEKLSYPILLYPFFSHINFPLKVGEHVWAMFEFVNDRSLGYWMSRIVEPKTVNDVNYTHADRKYQSGFKKSLKEKVGAEEFDDVPDFLNGLGYPSSYTLEQSGGENAYDELQKIADASKVHTYEPVPRFRKRPGDHIIEGSNNTLIVLGQDRGSEPSTIGIDGNTISLPESDQSTGAGSIDMVVGRGSSPSTAPLVIQNTRKQFETNKEPQRFGDEVANITEGDPDFINDLSRILITMSTLPDERLGFVPSFPNLFPTSGDNEPHPAIITKSDQIRIVARRDIRIVVAPPDGDANGDVGNFASIVIKQNGDIVFSPSENGVIKLGGDGADRAILCTDTAVVDPQQQPPGGRVTAAPIETTAAGKIGVGGGNLGTFSSKVLVVG